MMLSLACALLFTSSRAHLDTAAHQALWDNAREKLRSTSEKLKALGVSFEVAKEGLLKGETPFGSTLNVNCILTSDTTMRVEIDSRAGGEGGELSFAGAFEWGEEVTGLSGRGSISSGGSGVSSEYSYNRENGENRWTIEGNEGIWDTLVQMGDPSRGPVAAGLKLGAVKLLVDPYVMAKYVASHAGEWKIDAEEKIGGVSTHLSLQDLAYALRNAQAPPPHFAEEHLFVSLKGLTAAAKAGTAPDLGQLNHIDGFLADGEHGDFLLYGTHEPLSPPISTGVLTSLARAIFVNRRDPYISIDPNWEELSAPMHARIGGIPHELESCELVSRMLHADYAMKAMIMGVTPIDGLTSLRDLLAQYPEHTSMLRQRFWIMPQPLTELGDVHKGSSGKNTLYTFATQPVVRTMSANADAFDSGEPIHGPIEADLAAKDLTNEYLNIERQHPESGFGEVRQIFELSSAFALARQETLAPNVSSVLADVAGLLVPESDVKLEYAPLTSNIGVSNGRNFAITGGVRSVAEFSNAVESNALAQAAAGASATPGGWSASAPIAIDDLDPIHALSKQELSDRLVRLAESELERGQFDKAEALTRGACDATPKSADAWIEMARVRVARREYDQGVEAASRAVDLRPTSAVAHAVKALTLFMRGTAGQAWSSGRLITEFAPVDAEASAALDLEPGLGMAYWLRGSLKALASDWAGAVEQESRAIQAQPEFIVALASRAQMYGRLGEVAKALADADAYLSINPGNMEVRELRGDLYMLERRPADALYEYRIVSERRPKSSGAHLKTAQAALAVRDEALALDQADLALQVEPALGAAYLVRARAGKQLFHWLNAISDFRTAVRLTPAAELDRVETQREIDECFTHVEHSDEWKVGAEGFIQSGTPNIQIKDESIHLIVHKSSTSAECIYTLVNSGGPVKARFILPEQQLNVLADTTTEAHQMLSEFAVTVNGQPCAVVSGRNKVSPGSTEEVVTINFATRGTAVVRETYRADATFADMGVDSRGGTLREVTGQAVVFLLEYGSWERPDRSRVVTISFDPDSGFSPGRPLLEVPPETLEDYSRLRTEMLDHGAIGVVSPVKPQINGLGLTFAGAGIKAALGSSPGFIAVLLKSKVTPP